jgi:hypothetical protein
MNAVPEHSRAAAAVLRDEALILGTNMICRCDCGADYAVVPKEIPLANDEHCTCAGCGCELRGRWSSRNFDYEPLCPRPEDDLSSVESRSAPRFSSKLQNSKDKARNGRFGIVD